MTKINAIGILHLFFCHLFAGIRHIISRRLNWLRIAAIIPRSTFISPSAIFVGRDIYIGPNSRIEDRVFMRCGVHAPGYERIEIGSRCRIWHGVELHSWGGNILIGDRTSLNAYCMIYGLGGVKIGSHVRIATHVVIVASNHRFDRVDIPIKEQGVTARGITIEDDVWIGAGATILDGVRVEKGAVIAAGAVVNCDVPRFSVVGGVPARIIRLRNQGNNTQHDKQATGKLHQQ